MTRGPHSFSVFAGEDVSIPIAVTNAAGSALSFAGMSARFVAARRAGGTAVLDSGASPATASVSLDLSSPSTGIATVSLADSDTDALEGTYYWELKLTDSSGNEVVTSYGYITFKRSLTSA